MTSTRIIGVTQKDNEILLYYAYAKNGKNFFKLIPSSDGFKFNGKSKYVLVVDAKKNEEPHYDWKDFKISQQKDTYFVSYKLNSHTYSHLNGALSSDLLRWVKTGKIDNIKESGIVVPEYQYKNKYVMYTGGESINLASSSNFTKSKKTRIPIQ